MAILFAGTLAAAWALTAARAAPPALSQRHAPAGWPISFSLPEDCVPLQAGLKPTADSLPEGPSGYAAFTFAGNGSSSPMILIMFGRLAAETTLTEAVAEFTDEKVSPGAPIDMGAFAGQWMRKDPQRQLLAVACSTDGLAVAVQYVSRHIGDREMVMFENICASIELAR